MTRPSNARTESVLLDSAALPNQASEYHKGKARDRRKQIQRLFKLLFNLQLSRQMMEYLKSAETATVAGLLYNRRVG